MGVSVVTTVLTPAGSYDLTDLATVKDELDIARSDTSKDAFLSRAITQASKAIANYCNRVFAVEAIQDYFDINQDPFPYQTPSLVRKIRLSRFPVTALTSVVQTIAISTTQTLVQDTDFKMDAEKGEIMRLNPFTGVADYWEAVPVTVQYSAGYAITPDDLVDACLRVVTMRYRARGRDPMLVQHDIPNVGTQRFWVGPTPGQVGPFPPEIAQMLDGTYRVPVVA